MSGPYGRSVAGSPTGRESDPPLPIQAAPEPGSVRLPLNAVPILVIPPGRRLGDTGVSAVTKPASPHAGGGIQCRDPTP